MKIKNLFLIGVAALLATVSFTPAVHAQSPIYDFVPLVTFTNGYSTATNLTAYTIDTGKQASVAVQIVITNAAADAVNKTAFYYQRSVDGTFYETLLSPVGVTMTATTQNLITNLPTQGAGYMRFAYSTNTCGAGTNNDRVILKYAVKISAP